MLLRISWERLQPSLCFKPAARLAAPLIRPPHLPARQEFAQFRPATARDISAASGERRPWRLHQSYRVVPQSAAVGRAMHPRSEILLALRTGPAFRLLHDPVAGGRASDRGASGPSGARRFARASSYLPVRVDIAVRPR